MVLDTTATRALLERAYTKIKEQREQIERLEALYAGENGEPVSAVTFGRLHRADRPR